MIAPGVFGKLPSQGDFLLRGLPASFADPWHAWLVRGLATAREALAARFEPAYMAAPVWRFALPPAACGPDPAAGVMLPSVDAAGRLFPLTIAAIGVAFGPAEATAAALPWFEALEQAGRDALAGDPNTDAWMAGVAALAPPPSPAPLNCAHVPRSSEGALQPAVLPVLAAFGAAHAVLLWCEGSPFVRACALVAPALPEGACFVRLLSDPAEAAQ
ncbi:type VI secretion system-associated protein TagF [Falsiroseomonas sp.]|uniref:type VI secretion system-associated protein TagF n=1 Tax=Falsiroseomonas sp. TaxID=2870721 RepID=UPI0035674A0A